MSMRTGGIVEAASSSAVVLGPRVLASMSLGFRATLLERGHWTAVRAALERRDLDACLLVDGLRGSEWLPLSAHVALVEAAADVLGLDGVRNLGFLRTQGNTMGGLFPTLLRSWVRSFRDDPASLVRIGPQIWQTAFRDAGEFVIDDVRPSGASFRIVGCAALAGSPAWQHLVEGAAAGIMELAGRRQSLVFHSDAAGTTYVELEWREANDSETDDERG